MGLEERNYTHEEAMALDRMSQMKVLRLRKVRFSSRSKEVELVALILKSNGDIMAKKKIVKEEVKKVEEPKVEEVKKVEEGKYYAVMDINLTYRKGDVVPESVVAHWKKVGFNIDLMVK